jgi:hypothetical protein
MVLASYLGARTCLWAPLLVDARRPFWPALAESWELTRGSVAKLVALALILIVPLAPIGIVELAMTEYWHASAALLVALYVLAVAAVYSLVRAAPEGTAD